MYEGNRKGCPNGCPNDKNENSMSQYNPNIHHRRSIRLKGYEYSQAGLYFITICCQDRACLFGGVVKGEMILNDAGMMVENEWNQLHERFTNIQLHEYIVMPNHFHAILEIVGATLVVAAPNGETVSPNGETVAPNGETVAPNGETVAPNGETVAPQRRNGRPQRRNGRPQRRNGRPQRRNGRPQRRNRKGATTRGCPYAKKQNRW
ncbi:MAG: transposase [Sphingobacteriales bacterium]|nr:transposase [Sphingobacteriales bacterium]